MPLVLAGVLFVISIVTSVSVQRTALASLPREVIPAAHALRSHAHPGARVMALKSHIAYYAGLDFVPMPATNELSDLAESCRQQGVEHLYYSWLEANNRPSFWYLLDPRAEVPGLSRDTFVFDHPAALYRIGAGFGQDPAWLADDRARTQSESRMLAVMPPQWVWRAHLSLAVAGREQQRWREVVDHAAVVIRNQPTNSLGWRLLGDASLRLGDRVLAITAFERALALEPGSVDTRIRLGWLLLGSGLPDRAAVVWRPAVRATSNRETLERMIELFQARGDAAAAQQARDALSKQ